MRTELAVDVPVRAFAEQVEIEFAERRREAIRVFDILHRAVGPGDPQPIVAQPWRHRAREQAVILLGLELADDLSLRVDELHRGCPGL